MASVRVEKEMIGFLRETHQRLVSLDEVKDTSVSLVHVDALTALKWMSNTNKRCSVKFEASPRLDPDLCGG